MLTKWLWKKTVESEAPLEAGLLIGILLLFPFVPAAMVAIDLVVLLFALSGKCSVWTFVILRSSAFAAVRYAGNRRRRFVSDRQRKKRDHEQKLQLAAETKQKAIEATPEFRRKQLQDRVLDNVDIIDAMPLPEEDRIALKNEQILSLAEMMDNLPRKR